MMCLGHVVSEEPMTGDERGPASVHEVLLLCVEGVLEGFDNILTLLAAR